EYNWDFADGMTSIDQSTSHYYDSIGVYTVELVGVDSNSCRDTCETIVNITPYHDIIVPTAFTPDPNGGNGGTYDIFGYDNNVFFSAADYVVKFHMMIFNRWGEMVFESNDINIGWDGYYRGQLCQQDSYAWRVNVIFIDLVDIVRIGEVTLIR
ncbi:MAG: gliding motility-associated C-terminal domain-containing protein, partial [Flavobacteriales bacterium]|nr:gliding motility-associated C-terminal domain-containing protein [Flavobacteriales bacterium]